MSNQQNDVIDEQAVENMMEAQSEPTNNDFKAPTFEEAENIIELDKYGFRKETGMAEMIDTATEFGEIKANEKKGAVIL